MDLAVTARARATSSSACSGAVQLTPTATTRSVTSASANAASTRSPWRVWPPSAGEAEPGRRARARRQQLDQGPALVDRRDRLDRQQVGAGLGQDGQPRCVPGGQLGDPQAVVAAILRPVGEHGSVWPDGGGDQKRRCESALDPDLGEVPAACLHSQLDAPAEELGRRRPVDPARRETLKAALVAGTCGHPGAGSEIGQVSRHDLIGCFDQQAGRPQGIGQVVASSLELGRQASINHGDFVGLKQLLDRRCGHGSIFEHLG